MIKEKTFYKSFMVLALSLALQNLLTYGVNLMDTMMLGRYSQDAMGGVSLCNQVQFLLQMLVVGAGEGRGRYGLAVLGQNKLEPIPHIIGVALRFGGSLAVLMFGIVLFFRTSCCRCCPTRQRSSRKVKSISRSSALPILSLQ